MGVILEIEKEVGNQQQRNKRNKVAEKTKVLLKQRREMNTAVFSMRRIEYTVNS